MIAIVDSGGANLASVAHAFARLGEPAALVRDPAAVRAADRVVLPGVGAARRAMAMLGATELVDVVRALARPVLGICLGMQLLFETSAEGGVACLGILPGRVTRFAAREGRPVPHMGWNQVTTEPARPSRLLAGIPDGTHFYFVHSYRADPDGAAVCGTADYGERFAAVVEHGNFTGVQFHPERSGAAGAQLLAQLREAAVSFRVYPAIDLIGGACVRLAQGDFARADVYDREPETVAARFALAGATHLHVVDLDGARDRERRQTALIARIAAATPARAQVGGGVRSSADVGALLALGADRVVIGSLAVRDPDETARAIAAHGADRITLALDVALDTQGVPRVAVEGWRETTGRALDDVLAPYRALGITRVLCTDIARDGMMVGPNVALYRAMLAAHPGIELLASGGVRSLADLRELASTGAAGAIVGRAIDDGSLDLAAAVRAC